MNMRKSAQLPVSIFTRKRELMILERINVKRKFAFHLSLEGKVNVMVYGHFLKINDNLNPYEHANLKQRNYQRYSKRNNS